MVKRRSKNANGRMDAAIDHFTPMGYSKADIRRTVNRLLHEDMYGKDGWPLLEENCYYVVQEALLDKEQEEKLQLLLQQEEQEEEEEEQQQLLQEDEEEEQQQQEREEEEEEVQHQEAAMQEVPLKNDMPIVKVHNEVPSEVVLAVEEIEEVVPMIIDPHARKATLPLPAATGTGRTRRPCYGWISESESDSDYEEQPVSQQHEVHVPSPGGDLLCERKRLSRWDVK